MRDTDRSVGDQLDNTDHEAPQAGNILWAVAGAAAILIEVTIDPSVAAIFNGPVIAVEFENALWMGFFRVCGGLRPKRPVTRATLPRWGRKTQQGLYVSVELVWCPPPTWDEPVF